MLIALTSSTDEHLEKHVNPRADFRELMVTPEKFRGHVVAIRSVFRHVEAKNVNLAGVTKVWQGELADISGQVVSFVSLEAPPASLKPGQPVAIVGIFLKRYAYLNRQAGEMLTWSPLVFIRKLVPIVEPEEVEPAFGSSPLSIILFTVIGLGIFAAFWHRSKARVARNNPFTRLKAGREGPKSAFPRPPKKD